MNVSEAVWKSRLNALVSQLARNSDLRSAPWRAAFAETPRHMFVPTVISITESDSTTLSGANPAQQQSWLDQVYSDDSLVTQGMAHPSLMTASNQPLLVSRSSSTMPSLMARMLEALDVRDGHRVLEIGTGTGYNAALLCHRLGSANVVSIDIDSTLVAMAKNRLASLGHHPTAYQLWCHLGRPNPGRFGVVANPLPSSSGLTPTKAGTDGPFRLFDLLPVDFGHYKDGEFTKK